MLVAHLVPGYFAGVKSALTWSPTWNRRRRVLLWTAALASTIAPDVDVIYNALFRGFMNHSTLWTHSIFVHLIIVFVWWLMWRTGCWPYGQTLLGLIAIGGLSHLCLDVVSHSTPLLYPLSLHMIGVAPARVLKGGFWAYITDPIFLAEPVLLAFAMGHWIFGQAASSRIKQMALSGLIMGLIIFITLFLSFLPTLQALAVPTGASKPLFCRCG